jgi:CHAD domain-containing protein
LATGLKGSKAGKARRKIRRLTRALGTVRELDVTLTLLDELARSPHVSRNAVEDVRARVVAARDAGRKVMLERLERVDAAKLEHRLASVGASLQTAVAEPWRKALASRLAKRARDLSDSVNAAGHMYAPDRLHVVRVAAKKLRYGLELANDSGIRDAAAHVRTLKRAQDMLGKLHDLQVLQGYVAAVLANGTSSRPQAREGLEDLSRHIEDQCRHLHGRYVALVPSLREVVIAVRKTVVPQLAHAPRRVSPVKMGLARAPRGAALHRRAKDPRSVASDR